MPQTFSNWIEDYKVQTRECHIAAFMRNPASRGKYVPPRLCRSLGVVGNPFCVHSLRQFPPGQITVQSLLGPSWVERLDKAWLPRCPHRPGVISGTRDSFWVLHRHPAMPLLLLDPLVCNFRGGLAETARWGSLSPFPLSVIVLVVTLAVKCSTFRVGPLLLLWGFLPRHFTRDFTLGFLRPYRTRTNSTTYAPRPKP